MSREEGESATERGGRVLEQLIALGQELGFASALEYPVHGGRIDLVWQLPSPTEPMDGLPVVAFEIESSWRTRKHLKGDYLNLVDLQPALGVLLLLGDGEDVESTKRFARAMVESRPGRIEVWDESDIARLSRASTDAPENVDEGPATVESSTVNNAIVSRHSGKYAALYRFLVEDSRQSVDMSFEEVEELIGMPLPASCRKHEAHWYGYDNTAVGRAIRDAGWKVRNVHIREEHLTFYRETP